ncbi:hypothetical protein M0804_006800 [Polistes exclamans]|nr:hypothetical protein M0804_006800 [Polistes exclamans]
MTSQRIEAPSWLFNKKRKVNSLGFEEEGEEEEEEEGEEEEEEEEEEEGSHRVESSLLTASKTPSLSFHSSSNFHSSNVVQQGL